MQFPHSQLGAELANRIHNEYAAAADLVQYKQPGMSSVATPEFRGYLLAPRSIHVEEPGTLNSLLKLLITGLEPKESYSCTLSSKGWLHFARAVFVEQVTLPVGEHYERSYAYEHHVILYPDEHMARDRPIRTKAGPKRLELARRWFAYGREVDFTDGQQRGILD